jgi:carbon-monoxide dehydrogenase medium subunit
MTSTFVLHRPTTVADAIALAVEHGDTARFYAGGTELLLVLREGFLAADHLIDVKRIPALIGVRAGEDGGIHVGAATAHTDVERSPLIRTGFPVLAALESRIANVRVRNTGTIGGNLCFAEPHGDPAALLVAAGAQLALVGPEGPRTVLLEDWIRGPFDVDIRSGEILAEIEIPPAPSRTGYGYRRFRSVERPSVAVAARVDLAGDGSVAACRLVAGCAGPRPQRLARAEAGLTGVAARSFPDATHEVARIAAEEADVMDDAYGPVDHKRALIRVLARRAVLDAAVDADRPRAGETPA